ncbi:hypothetical protein [Chryseobacterium sp. W4I1]|uniref:hypothetical protein n=1 Tax=Chryseobacterium sp. W4I1 TaxID=3042293 RepID=UPI0027878AEC|nr:hypothetical protein [Chryseobacterium sp. W4I1]MDQ0782083.1 DNA-binding transcriptional MocR family regulator [Chryseobacterium sp. W4I1]
MSPYISYVLPSGGMAFWIRLSPEYPVRHLIKIPQLKILRTDEKLNAFRFGFASMDEKELEITVDFLKTALDRF